MAWQWMVAGWGRQEALMEPGWAYSSIPITTGIGMSLPAMLVELFRLNKEQSISLGAVVLYMAHLCPRERIVCVEGHSRPHHGRMLLSFYVGFRT